MSAFASSHIHLPIFSANPASCGSRNAKARENVKRLSKILHDARVRINIYERQSAECFHCWNLGRPSSSLLGHILWDTVHEHAFVLPNPNVLSESSMQFGSVDLLPPWCRSSVSGRGRQNSEEQWQNEIQDYFDWKSSSDCLPSQSAAKKTPEKKFAQWLNDVRKRRNIPGRLRAQWEECCPELFDQSLHQASSSK